MDPYSQQLTQDEDLDIGLSQSTADLSFIEDDDDQGFTYGNFDTGLPEEEKGVRLLFYCVCLFLLSLYLRIFHCSSFNATLNYMCLTHPYVLFLPIGRQLGRRRRRRPGVQRRRI